MNLLEQAARAERLAMQVMDNFAFEALMAYARECRQRADALEGSSSPVHGRFEHAVLKDPGRQLAL